MTREEFIQSYAKGCARLYAFDADISDEWALIGLLEITKEWRMIALPCACGNEGCEGWGMVGIEQIDHHLLFDAPDYLREAYEKALQDKGGIK